MAELFNYWTKFLLVPETNPTGDHVAPRTDTTIPVPDLLYTVIISTEITIVGHI